uniref:Uncharacterized protein n=1 Tax=Lactuca sativa TaxID=4236 RepID=A0A9R1X958_LACSA|nr:hypothetical protein LSAT_V11C600334000 [Lactuca sativa]
MNFDIAFYCFKSNIIFFDSFDVDHIPFSIRYITKQSCQHVTSPMTNVLVSSSPGALHKFVDEKTNIKIKSKAICLGKYELDIFDFIVGMTILYHILVKTIERMSLRKI